MESHEMRRSRISRVSRVIALFCGIFLALLPLLVGVLSFLVPQFLLMQPVAVYLFPGLSFEDLSAGTKAAAFGSMMVQSIPMLWILWTARLLYQGYAAGVVFTVEAIRHIRQIALALLSMVLVRPLGEMLFCLALSMEMPQGQKQLVIRFGSDEVWIGLAGLMVLVTAWIMSEAAAMAEENKSFV